MRILLLNPNTTKEVTERLWAAGRSVAAHGTELIPLTAARGVPYIATRAEAQIGGAIALEMLAEHHATVDAAIIAAFGDPGLLGARELFDIPVIGLAEAAMLTACMLGRRFAIVTFARALGPWYQDCVDMHGLNARCAGIRTLDSAFDSDRRRAGGEGDRAARARQSGGVRGRSRRDHSRRRTARGACRGRLPTVFQCRCWTRRARR